MSLKTLDMTNKDNNCIFKVEEISSVRMQDENRDYFLPALSGKTSLNIMHVSSTFKLI